MHQQKWKGDCRPNDDDHEHKTVAKGAGSEDAVGAAENAGGAEEV